MDLPVNKLIGWLIGIAAFVAIFLIMFSPSGLIAKATQKTPDTYLPNMILGPGVSGEKPTIPEEHKKEIQSLKDTIQRMLSSSNKPCFANYGGFSSLGEKGVSIIMEYNSAQSKTSFLIQGGAGGQQVITDMLFDINGMVPCVIAGNSQIVGAFSNSFLDESVLKKEARAGHFNPVNSIQIQYKPSAWGGLKCNSGNQISVPGLGINNQCNNLQDGGYLYTPDNRHICFFPTIYGSGKCEGERNADGLDNDCLGQVSKDIFNSIPSQIKSGKLATC